MRERMLRIAADFENFKKRARRDQSDAEAKSRENVLRDMLDVVDNLERAVSFNDTSDLKAIQQGVQLVLRLFQSRLERYQVRPFEAQGKPFDPRVHEAVAQVPSAEVPPGSVLKELMKGYTIGDRLLRPAAVAVALAPRAATDEGDGGNNGAGGPAPATGEGPPAGED
jgi:molecular chaperone GrpE